jgi:ADP-heptose:LPS heptosyltransferase
LKILFITNTRIGDAILSSGVLHYLVETYPDARFTVVCGRLPQTLFAAVPRLDRVIILKKRRFDLHWFDLWRQLKGTRWDIVVDLRRSFISFFLDVGARYVIGPANDAVHRVQHLSSVLRLGRSAPPHIYVAPRHEQDARRLIPPGPPVLVLAPVAAAQEKTWPAERFAALAAALRAGPCAGWRIALFGGPGDDTKAGSLLDAFPDALKVFGEPDLLTVAAALKNCAAFIGNDSGLAHLSAAVGLPTLALFGPSDPIRYAPFGDKARFLQAPNRDITGLSVVEVAAAARGIIL